MIHLQQVFTGGKNLVVVQILPIVTVCQFLGGDRKAMASLVAVGWSVCMFQHKEPIRPDDSAALLQNPLSTSHGNISIPHTKINRGEERMCSLIDFDRTSPVPACTVTATLNFRKYTFLFYLFIFFLTYILLHKKPFVALTSLGYNFTPLSHRDCWGLWNCPGSAHLSAPHPQPEGAGHYSLILWFEIPFLPCNEEKGLISTKGNSDLNSVLITSPSKSADELHSNMSMKIVEIKSKHTNGDIQANSLILKDDGLILSFVRNFYFYSLPPPKIALHHTSSPFSCCRESWRTITALMSCAPVDS